MKKKLARKHHVHHQRRVQTRRAILPHHFVVVRGWMFLVAFALMLGLGAVVGNFVNEQLNQSSPQVAGASVEK